MKNSFLFSVSMCCLIIPMQSIAVNLEVNIAEDKPYTLVNHGEDLVKVQRIQDTSNTLGGAYTKTSRPCPPYCVNPVSYTHLTQPTITDWWGGRVGGCV